MTREEREAIKRAQQEKRRNAVKSEPKDEGNSVDALIKELNEIPMEQIKKVEESKPIKMVEDVPVRKEEPKIKPKTSVKPSANKNEDSTLINIHFLDIDDRVFFKVAPKLKGLKVSGQYLISLVDQDEKATYDVKDEFHQHVISLKKKDFYDQTSTTIPTSYKTKITIQAAQHRMNESQYMAYLIHQARMATPGWN